MLRLPCREGDEDILSLQRAQAIELYRQMLLIRRFEETSSRLYMQGKIRGFLHLYIGQEAVAAGAVPMLNVDDYVVSHYRDHGHALARGMDPKVVMAELCGKSTGSSGGKGGSMHLFDASRNFMGGYAIVGGQLPIAVGLALAIKYRKQRRVVMCFFGDGRCEPGRVPRVSESGIPLEAARTVLSGEQPLRHGDPRRPHTCGWRGHIPGGGALQDSGRSDRWHGRRGRQGGDERGFGSGQRHGRSGLLGGDDLQIQRALPGRPEEYRDQDEVTGWRGRDPIDRSRGSYLATACYPMTI